MVTLKLLTFIAQRGLKSLAQERKLEPFIDELKSKLDNDGVLHELSDYQLLLSQSQSLGCKECVEAALQQSEQALDRIARKARRAFTLQAKSTAVATAGER